METVGKKFSFNGKEYQVIDLGKGVWTVIDSNGNNLTVREFSVKGLVEAATVAKNSQGDNNESF